MCSVPLDPIFFFFGSCAGMWIVFIYSNYKSRQTLQTLYNDYEHDLSKIHVVNDKFYDDTL